jgi:hypothetical protein
MAVNSSLPPAPSGARRTVADFDSYGDAERAVERLADHGFPVEHVTIVGSGLRYVEQIAGRVTTGSAALGGAAQGAPLGVVLSLLFGLVFTVDDGSLLGVLVYGSLVGAVVGALLGAVMHAVRGGRHDFTSIAGTQPERYELQVDDGRSDEASRLLARVAGR